MNVFQRIKRWFVRDVSLNDPKAWDPSLWNLYGSQSISGETVNEHTALTYSAVWNAVQLISGTIASLPLHLMQRSGKKRRIADNKKVYSVLHDEANPLMTAEAFRKVIMSHILTWGNGYAEIVRDSMGDVMQLWPITPDRVKPEMIGGDIYYRISMESGSDIYLRREQVLHVAGLGFDGFIGYSVVSMARKSLGLGMAMETFGGQYFSNGTNPGMIVTHPGKLSPDAHKNLVASMEASNAGLGKTHRLMLFEEGMKAEKVTIPPNDSQFIESRQFQIPEIARWFNLPPHKLKDLTKSSFSNIEQEQISFVTDSIVPWLVTLEQNYNMQLLSRGDKLGYGGGRYYFKHIVEGLLRGDSENRAKFYSVMLDKGVFSINEVRELEDKDPVDGGDIHLVPLNMTTLENTGEPPEPQEQPSMEPEAQEENDQS